MTSEVASDLIDYSELDLLFKKHREDLLRRANCWASGRAEDILHDAYIKMRAHWPHLRHRRNLLGFAFRVMFNLAMDHHRGSEVLSNPVDDSKTFDPLDTNHELETRYDLALSLLDEAIKSIDQPGRVIWKMTLRGMTPREISPLIGLTTKQIGNAKHRAKIQIAEFVLRKIKEIDPLMQ